MKRSRRLLLISYHFGSDSTGGFRWAEMLPYLNAAGWAADVITATPHAADTVQGWADSGVTITVVKPIRWLERASSVVFETVHSLRMAWERRGSDSAEVDSDEGHRRNLDAIRIHRPDFELSLWSAAGQASQEGVLAATLLYWSLRAARKGARLWGRHHHDAIVVSSPPHWTQLAGVLIARDTDSPLILDLRDPWSVGVTEMNAYEPNVVRTVTGRVEVGMQRRATVVIHNTEQALERALEFTPPYSRVRRVVIPNGYDDPPPDVEMDRATFKILFSGWLYPFMDPRPLLSATAALVTRHGLSPAELRIQFVGSADAIGDVPLRDIFKAFGLEAYVDLVPRLQQRQRALEMQAQAAVLVAFDYPQPLCVVMKAYDYLQMPGALLFLADPGSSLAELGDRVGCRAVAPRDAEGILKALEDALAAWRLGVAKGPHDPERAFHRSRAAKTAVDLLEGLVGARENVLVASTRPGPMLGG